MTEIKFGTDGWRAIIAREFTVDNVLRVTEGVSAWLLANFKEPSVVIGHDCRFGGSLFLQAVVSGLNHHGIKVFYAEGFVSTPMVSLGTKHHQADLGIVITASHNPPEYNGYKLKGSFGGPLLPDDIAAVEKLIPNEVPNIELKSLKESPLCVKTDLEQLYIDRVYASFDINKIKKSGLNFAYDAMFGAGQNVMKRIFPEIAFLHCDNNPGFHGTAPEPIMRNLMEFSDFIKKSGKIHCGLATDGDADRIGLFDSIGNFVDSHHIILLLIHYLKKYKNYTGKVITAFSVSEKLKKLCDFYHIEQETVKIGFKYIAGHFIHEDVMLGGEESGGIAVKGHIPERDGIWMGLIVWEFMAKSGKTLEELIQEVYEIVGPFKYDRSDLHLTNEKKEAVIEKCRNNGFTSFAGRPVRSSETLDGFKYHFDNEEWLMIRASGTEPVLRIYAESKDDASVKDFMERSVQEILS